MSFRLADLKKSVRKGREGYQVTPGRLEGRPAAFRLEFLLQQFEGHLGCPRRLLDPRSLLEYMGDIRLGRGLLATLSQWYRVRARRFHEVLPDGGAALRERGIEGPVDLRAWLYSAVNRGGKGYLDPEAEPVFWKAQTRALGLRREVLEKLVLLDCPDEAVLVRTGPAPAAADVMAAYNARAHTTLIRSSARIELHSAASAPVLERAARAWAAPLGVEWQVEGGGLRLSGRADALGSWSRHGRRVERAALELLALPELAVRELRGEVETGDRRCQFVWKADTLGLLRAGRGGPLQEEAQERIDALASLLRRERDRGEAAAWSIRRASHPLGVAGGVFLPHLELRHGDLAVYVRLVGSEIGAESAGALAPFRGKTPVAAVAWSGREDDPLTLQVAGRSPEAQTAGGLLPALASWLDQLTVVPQSAAGRPSPARRAA